MSFVFSNGRNKFKLTLSWLSITPLGSPVVPGYACMSGEGRKAEKKKREEGKERNRESRRKRNGRKRRRNEKNVSISSAGASCSNSQCR